MKILNKNRLIPFIAMNQLKFKKVQAIVAIISVTFGVAVFIYIAGYINGVNKWVRDMTLAESPDIRLFNESGISSFNALDKHFSEMLNVVDHQKPKSEKLNLKNGKRIIQEIQNDFRVKAVSYTVKSQVYYHIGSTNISGIITGIDFFHENNMLNIDNKIVSGSFEGFSSIPNSLIMGEKLRQKLNLSIGDKVHITSEEGYNIVGVLIGSIKTGIPDIDKDICYANERTVQNLIGANSSYITEIKVKLFDMSIASSLADEYSNKYLFKSSNWQIDNAALFEGAELQNVIFDCIALSILLVAGFGIFNILNMIIYEKIKDIAIIKAMGFSDKDVQTIFITQALLIGIIGGIFGLILGFLLSFGTSLIPYNSDVFVSVDHIPMNFNALFYFGAFVFALMTTFFAGYIPAKKASRLDPVSILRE